MQSFTDGLNAEQAYAVLSQSDRILMLAGAGTGKTKTLTHRLAHLNLNCRVGVSSIIAITFTRAAAKEMKDRLIPLIGKDAKKLICCTFHALAVRILQEWGHRLGLDRQFTIYSREDRIEVINSIIKKGEYRTTYKRMDDLNWQFIKNSQEVAVWNEYQWQLKRFNAVDLDYLIPKVNELFTKHPDVAEYYRKVWRYAFVDEFQDTSENQLQLIKSLNPVNLFGIGDDFQCWHAESLVLTLEGFRMVEDLKIGDMVETVINGRSKFVELTGKSGVRKDKVLLIKTESGKVLKVTPEHKCFATFPELGDGSWYVYMMFRSDRGYRIGVTKGGLNGVIGARTFSESPEKLWFLAKFDTINEAHLLEDRLSLTYKVPKNPYNHNGRGIALTQDDLNSLFCEFGMNGFEILKTLRYDFDNPHYIPSGTTRHSKSHSNVYLFLNYQAFAKCFVSYEKEGLRIRKNFSGKGAYVNARIFAEIVLKEQAATMIVERYCHKTQKPLLVIPASSLLVGMEIPVINDFDTTSLESIVSVDFCENADVYHLEASDTGIIVADQVVSHNCIYSFNGARVDNILEFPETFPGTEIIKLETNYRSTRQIVEAANNLISHNINQTEKNLFSDRDGDEVEITTYQDAEAEANAILKIIQTKDEDKPYSDFAVLARTNAQIEFVYSTLKNAGIPCLILSGSDDPLKKHDIKYLIAYLDCIFNQKDETNFKRVLNFPEQVVTEIQLQQIEQIAIDESITLREALGYSNDERVLEFHARFNGLVRNIQFSANVTDALRELIFYLDLEKHYKERSLVNRVNDLQEAIQYVAYWCERQERLGESYTAQDFLKWVRIRDITEKLMDQREAVRIMTIHGSKGLEFPTVFVIGMNEGTFPHRKIKSEDMEEERRLAYVAVTRAKWKLYLSSTRMTTSKWGKDELSFPSRFIQETKYKRDSSIKEIERGDP